MINLKDNDNAADSLLGRTLTSGWLVIEKVDKPEGSTGGFFSVCYKVQKRDEICFLKAYNFARFFLLANTSGGTVSVVDVLAEMVEAYRYERDLSALCRDKYVTKIVFVREAGEENIPGFTIGLVPYLIFDLADGNLRHKLSFASDVENSWKLKALHSIAVGISQLHRINVSHQDIKPSNILIFKDETKLGDLGRSTCESISSRLKDLQFSGDLAYAPPEVLYNVADSDWKRRSFASDIYLFGSITLFFFSGLTMTALLRKHLPDELSWEKYRGKFEDVKGYLVSAFSKSLDEFEQSLSDPYLRQELREVVEYLCHPLPEKRGHPKVMGSRVDQYDMTRVISKMDLLYYKIKYKLQR